MFKTLDSVLWTTREGGKEGRGERRKEGIKPEWINLLSIMDKDGPTWEGGLIKLAFTVSGLRIFLKEDKGSEERFLLCAVCKQLKSLRSYLYN